MERHLIQPNSTMHMKGKQGICEHFLQKNILKYMSNTTSFYKALSGHKYSHSVPMTSRIPYTSSNF